MLTIDKQQDGSRLTLTLAGRLDAATSPTFERELRESLDDVTELVLDMQKVSFVSSAGLRVILYAQKVMAERGSMVLRHVSEDVNEVLVVTGFSGILTIE